MAKRESKTEISERLLLGRLQPKARRRIRVSRIPLDVQTQISKEHPERSVTDYIIGILSRRYGFEWQSSGARGRRQSIDSVIVIKVPEHLWIELKKEATPYSTMSAVIIKAIREGTE